MRAQSGKVTFSSSIAKGGWDSKEGVRGRGGEKGEKERGRLLHNLAQSLIYNGFSHTLPREEVSKD